MGYIKFTLPKQTRNEGGSLNAATLSGLETDMGSRDMMDLNHIMHALTSMNITGESQMRWDASAWDNAKWI